MKSNQTVAEIGQQLSLESPTNYLRNLFLLSGKALHQLSTDYRFTTPSVEKPFRSVKEVEELLQQNYRTLFGEKSILISLPKKKTDFFKNADLSNFFLLDVHANRFYFLYVLLGQNHDFLKDIFPRFTSFFLYLLDEKNIEELTKYICKESKKELQALISAEDLFSYVKQIVASNASILAVTEKEWPELAGMKQLYPQPWRSVFAMTLKKYISKGDSYCSIFPAFNEFSNQRVKPEREKKEKVNFTEEFHLERASEQIKSAYLQLKEQLLKLGNMQFVPQRYYIALRNERNIAFFHIRKNKIDLVVKYPEKETRKLIKKHEVKHLKESVMKFWGGESVSVIIENANHLEELVGLLRKMVEGR
jgi:predicted transport protein